MTDRDSAQPLTLADHEKALLSLGRYMAITQPGSLDYARLGLLIADVVNGLPAVRAIPVQTEEAVVQIAIDRCVELYVSTAKRLAASEARVNKLATLLDEWLRLAILLRTDLSKSTDWKSPLMDLIAPLAITTQTALASPDAARVAGRIKWTDEQVKEAAAILGGTDEDARDFLAATWPDAAEPTEAACERRLGADGLVTCGHPLAAHPKVGEGPYDQCCTVYGCGCAQWEAS